MHQACLERWSKDGTIDPAEPITLWVDLLGDLQSVRVGQVSVGGCDGQDEAALLVDELQQHLPDLVLDVRRLVSDGHFGHPRKIDEGQVQHCSGTRRPDTGMRGSSEKRI